MGQLGHVTSLVELGRIDLVNVIWMDFSLLLLQQFQYMLSMRVNLNPYRSIFALHQQLTRLGLLNNPSSYERIFGILEPHISTPGEVIFTLDASYLLYPSSPLF